MQKSNFMARIAMTMAITGIAAAQMAPHSTNARSTHVSSVRPQRGTSRPGTVIPFSQTEVRAMEQQQARKSGGSGRPRGRVLRWRFRAIAGMKARKVGIPLFDRNA
jgi:hypothetical protein